MGVADDGDDGEVEVGVTRTDFHWMVVLGREGGAGNGGGHRACESHRSMTSWRCLGRVCGGTRIEETNDGC